MDIKLRTHKGWLLDVYPDKKEGAVVWFIGQDGGRYRFTHLIPAVFYAAGENTELRSLWEFCKKQKLNVQLSKERQEELFDGTIDVLAIHIANAAHQSTIFRKINNRFPAIDYYNANIPFPLRYHALFDLFPLARCELKVDPSGEIHAVRSLDNRWEVEPALPPLRILEITPDSDSSRLPPESVRLKFGNKGETINTKSSVLLLQRVNEILATFDPDIIATQFGDRWLFPFLIDTAEKSELYFNPNREKRKQPLRVKENTYTSYGRVFHRDQQTLLFGRIHVDSENSSLFGEPGFVGFCQQARLTGHTLQIAARKSVGGGFTALQIRKALEWNILIPVNKRRREEYKSVADLIVSDRGGVIYQPTTGIFPNVAEIDFFSMYPSLMSEWNISPETVRKADSRHRIVPGIDRSLAQDKRGIVAEILKPILDLRREVNKLLERDDLSFERKKTLEDLSRNLKGLGWVSYGYQGFSGNRIGSIEAHEAINAVSRELILRAKEVAETEGFTVHHLYVDSLFISKHKENRPEVFQKLVKEMGSQTEIGLDFEGIFRWIAFLPSKRNSNVPVPNCFYGVFETGEIKQRGIMARRHDTPLYIKGTQEDAIKFLALELDFDQLRSHIPKLVGFLRGNYQKMMRGQIPAEELRIVQSLSNNLDEYKVPSAPARAAMQLVKTGKLLGAGQTVEYLRVKGDPDVLPWDLSADLHPDDLDYEEYGKLFIRASLEILQPFGIDEETLTGWLQGDLGYFFPEDYVLRQEQGLPLLEQAVRPIAIELVPQ
jgi:DNA polymerase-2